MPKFLFFLERELHLPMLKNIMKYIHRHALGEMAVYSLDYHASELGKAGWGIRPDILPKYLDFEMPMVRDPFAYNPDICFTADFSYQHIEGLGKIVNVGHGSISKGWFFSEHTISRRENCADLICVPGPLHKEILAKQVFKAVEVTGMPKLDTYFENQDDISQLKESMGLDPRKKTILFAPTFNQELSIMPHIRDQLTRYIPPLFNIVLKIHGASPEQWKEEYMRLTQRYKNMYYCVDPDISKSFLVADLLISDVSSVIYEFLALDKPVVLFDSPDMDKYPNHNIENIEYKYRDVGPRFSNLNDLAKILIDTINEPQLTEQQKEISRLFIQQPAGGATAKVINAALKLLEKPKNEGLLVRLSDKDSDKYNSYQQVVLNHSTDLFYTLDKLIRETKNEDIVIIDEWQNHSPLLVPLLFTHLRLNNDCGIIIPMNDKSNDNASWEDFHKHADINVVAIQVSYAGCGYLRAIHAPTMSPTFAIKKAHWLKNIKSGIKDMTAAWQALTVDANKLPKLALDCLTYTDKKNICSATDYFAKPKNDVKSLEKAIKLHSNIDKKAELLRAYYYETAYLKMIELAADSNEPLINFYAAAALFKINKNEAAWQKLDKIDFVEIDDDVLKSEIYALAAKIYIYQAEYTKASELNAQALALHADCKRAMINVGLSYFMQNKLANAQSEFAEIANKFPAYTDAKKGMALVMQASQRYGEAIDLYMVVLAAEPGDADIVLAVAECAKLSNNYAKAVEAVENYLDYCPADIEMMILKAEIYINMQDFEMAVNILEMLAIFAPDNYKAQKMLEILRKKLAH